jgi:carbamoyltransferase
LECFGSAPVDLLAIGPFTVRRTRSTLDSGTR